jgi:excisionase family DNA binding protein
MAGMVRQLCHLLSISDLAELLNTSTRTIHRLNSACLIPSAVRIGCRPRWRREEIEAWLKAGCPSRNEWEQMKE